MRVVCIHAFRASDAGLNHFQKSKVQVNCRRELHNGGEESVFDNLERLNNTHMSPVVELYGLTRPCNHRASVS